MEFSEVSLVFQSCLLGYTAVKNGNHFTRQYIPEDNSEHHTRRRENLKSHISLVYYTLHKCDD
jgi:hypothetical protein